MSETKTIDIETTLQPLLKLTPKQRIELAERLIESVPPTFGDPEIAEAWRVEIARRVNEAREGLINPVPAEEVHARIERKLTEQRTEQEECHGSR